MSNVDLSKVNSKSIASLVKENNEIIKKSCESGSVLKVYETVSKIFADAGVNTPATQRLLNNIRRAKSATEATFIVYNSMMAGMGCAVV